MNGLTLMPLCGESPQGIEGGLGALNGALSPNADPANVSSFAKCRCSSVESRATHHDRAVRPFCSDVHSALWRISPVRSNVGVIEIRHHERVGADRRRHIPSNEPTGRVVVNVSEWSNGDTSVTRSRAVRQRVLRSDYTLRSHACVLRDAARSHGDVRRGLIARAAAYCCAGCKHARGGIYTLVCPGYLHAGSYSI